MKAIYLLPIILACHSKTETHIIADVPIIKEVPKEVPIQITETKESPPKHEDILIIGDSEALFVSWRIKSVQKENETVLFDPKPGTTIGYWNYHFRDEMMKYSKLDWVIIFLGTNNNNFTFLQPYEDILNVVRERNLRCIWVGPTLVYGKHHKTNTMLRDVVSDDCIYVDTESLDIPLDDGVHCSIPGCIKWLKEIWGIKDLYSR